MVIISRMKLGWSVKIHPNPEVLETSSRGFVSPEPNGFSSFSHWNCCFGTFWMHNSPIFRDTRLISSWLYMSKSFKLAQLSLSSLHYLHVLGFQVYFPWISHRIAKVTWCSSQWEPQRCGSLGAPSPPRRCHWPPPCAGRRWPRPLLPRRRGRTSLNPGDASPILGECHGQMIIEWFVQSWSR